jgi:outer membrane protein TolC
MRVYRTIGLVCFLSVAVFTSVAFAQETKPTLTYTLDECFHMAMRQSPEILTAREEIKRAAGVVFEEWAGIVSVSADGRYTYRETAAGGSGLSSGGGTSYDQYDIGLNASLPLFTGGRILSGLSVVYLQRRIADEEYRQAVSDVIYDTVVAFYTILLAEREVLLRSEELELLTKNVEVTKNKYYDGLVPKYDLMRIEVELANATPLYLKAENHLASAYEDLKKLLGIDLDESIGIEGELVYSERRVILDEYIMAGDDESPELNIARLAEEIARKNVASARGNFFPSVSAFADYSYSTDTWDISFDRADWEFTAGVMLEIPISELLVAAAKKKQAKAYYEEAKISTEDTADRVTLEIKKAYYDLTESQKIVAAVESTVELAEENLAIAELRYENGVGTLLELLDARLALTQAKLNYLEAVFNYIEANARLDRIIGRESMND